MIKKLKRKSALLPALPAWFFVGSVIVLMGIIVTMAIKDLNRGREIEIQTLLDKSSVLIRAFESGTRTGMGLRWRHEQRQILLEEMAYQPGILYLAVTDASGKVLAHSNPKLIGTQLYSPQDIDALKVSLNEQWRLTTYIDEQGNRENSFEVYRFFKPLKRGPAHRGHMMNMRQPPNHMGNDVIPDNEGEANIVFTAFDTTALEAAQAKDIRNTAIFLSILLLLALASLLALFWARRYQHSSQQLQDSKAFSSEIISNLPLGLITTDAFNQISVVNHAAELMLGNSAYQLTGQNIRSALPVEWNQLAENSRNHQPIIEQEIDYVFADGQILPLSISVAKIINDSGSFLGNLFIFRDMRELRRLQEEIRRKEKLAAIGNLAAGVAHEIRNPLSSIKGFAKYFEGRSAQGSEEQELAKVMAKEVDRLNRVITELLDLVRPVDLRIKSVDINEVIEHSLYLIRQDAEVKNIAIHFDANPQLPLIEIDPDRFTQALLNLYLNAIQAIGSGGTLNVIVKSISGSGLKISVQDSGKGIPPEDLANIFNPYFTTKASGTGLGLAVVQKVIEQHQGKITVTSNPQSGTHFDMTIPLEHKVKPLSSDENSGGISS